MKNKFQICTLKKDFTKIPNKIFEMKLSINSIMVYVVFLSVPEKFNPSINWLANILHVSRYTVKRSINELLEKNIIKCIKKGNIHIVSRYEFTKIKDWICI